MSIICEKIISDKSNKSIDELKKKSAYFHTLDAKHKEMNSQFIISKTLLSDIEKKIQEINNSLNTLCDKTSVSNVIQQKNQLLDEKSILEQKYSNILENYNEMDYYDKIGDLMIDYYESKDDKECITETKDILDFLSEKKKHSKFNLLEKYYKRINGIKLNSDDGTNRLKFCIDCSLEKILNISDSSYICPCCGHTETIILDEDKQIKDYSPYKRLNHFREWINQFQAKQTPEIPEQVFIDIIKELNKNRITDLSLLNKKIIKTILKKLQYNIYYEHIIYIINKLNNLPPPRINRDMEKLFIIMFYKIQEPWLLYKKSNRKNFLSYSYVLYKFCELLELDHLLEYFPLHKDTYKIIENDQIWKKICNYLNWQFISSFK